jgi:hypothetical protein
MHETFFEFSSTICMNNTFPQFKVNFLIEVMSVRKKKTNINNENNLEYIDIIMCCNKKHAKLHTISIHCAFPHFIFHFTFLLLPGYRILLKKN